MHPIHLALAAAAAVTSALSIPDSADPALAVRASDVTPGCQNSATSRQCWGNYNIDTNYYDTIPRTGRTVTHYLTLEEIDCAPDGYRRKCMTANGTMPGPAITANWGDDVVVHVTNNIKTNGSAIHWHGVRQLNNTEYDGVPGVSQCPIAPGSSMTYKFHADQYGTSLYHSHFSLQYSMGLYGPIIINGPASANYDVDLGTVFLTDWDHQSAFNTWKIHTDFAEPYALSTGLINGMNTGTCVYSNNTAKDPNCVNGGKKFELAFQKGKKHRIRLISIATEAYFQFSIDQHSLTVMSTDFVPIRPYNTDSVQISMGQRYDLVVEANAPVGDYWMRSGFLTQCIANAGAANITGIVRYNTTSKKDPTTKSTVAPPSNPCDDVPAKNLVPWVPINLTNTAGGTNFINASAENATQDGVQYLRWGINGQSYMWVNWSDPAIGDVKAGTVKQVPASYNVFQVDKKQAGTVWALLVIEDQTPKFDISHPIHMHGHDFLVLATGKGNWNGDMSVLQKTNPPRRDVATLPTDGYLVIAWALDNPGIWAIHCHIAWHSSGGFAATLLESQSQIASSGALSDFDSVYTPTCNAWNKYYPTEPYPKDDSGI